MKVEVDIFKGRDGEPGSDGENGATGPPGSGGSPVLVSQFDAHPSVTMGFEFGGNETSHSLCFDTPSINELQIQQDPSNSNLVIIPSNGIYEITCNSRVISSVSSGNNARVGLTIKASVCTDYDVNAESNNFVEDAHGVASNYSTRHSNTGQSGINEGGVSLTRLFDLQEGDAMRFFLSAKFNADNSFSAEIIGGTFLIVKKVS